MPSTLGRDLQVWRRGHLVPVAFSTQLEFLKGNVPGYVCNRGSPRERDAASQGHTSGIPTRAMLHSWKLKPTAPHVLLSFPVMTSPAPDVSPSIGLITHMIQSLISLKGVPSGCFPRRSPIQVLTRLSPA